MSILARTSYLMAIDRVFKAHSICALLGPRQAGKTTLAQQFSTSFDQETHYFDLEDPDDLQTLQNPKLALEHLKGLVIIDEIQRSRDLFPYLRVLVDRNKGIKLLILGSASHELIHHSAETLAGRIGYIDVTPFSAIDQKLDRALWIRGGFPNSYLAIDETSSFDWRKSYIRTFLERDIPSFGFNLNPQLLRRFWTMLCDYHGNIFNASELGRALELDHKTTKRYLDILTSTFMIRQIQPWFANISKRQVKSPKIYFRDSGLFHTLLNLPDDESVARSTKIGASFEGFALEQIIQLTQSETQDCFFWSTQSGAEIDLLIVKGMQKTGFEIKYTSKPTITKSMHTAVDDLKLNKLTVIIPGDAHYFLSEQVEVWGLNAYAEMCKLGD